MSTPLGPHNVNEFLSAFADGELDAAQNLAVLDYLEQHPEAFAYLRDRQRLRQSAQRVVLANQHANTMPAALKARLDQVAHAEGKTPGGVRRKWKWWPHLLGAVAASLALGAATGFYGHTLRASVAGRPSLASSDDADTQRRDQPDARDAALPITLIRAATLVHLDCSRIDDRLHAGGYPAAVGSLPELVKADLGSPDAAPDLRAAGLRFIGAGPCPKPLESTVHLLYRSDGQTPQRTVSVFVQVYHGQFGLTAGRLYHIRQGTVLPLLAWRTERVLYLLMADEEALADDAVRLIPIGPTRPAS